MVVLSGGDPEVLDYLAVTAPIYLNLVKTILR
jgi:hypothetical protein